MGVHVDISPTKADGSWKSGEDVFIEAFKKIRNNPTKSKLASVFINEDILPKDISDKLIDMYGADWVDWLPETVKAQMVKDFGDVPESVFQKIFAIKVLLSNDDFWNDVYIFQNIILAFNNVYPDFGHFQEVSPAQLTHGLLESRKIRVFTFDSIIKDYTRNILFDSGLFVSPDELKFLGLDMANNIPAENLSGKDEETFEGIQSAKLRAIKIYLEERKNANKQ